ncbi:MAG: hypothetical protein QXO70_02665, partial [Candidatus Pacearchaeota archaeon]
LELNKRVDELKEQIHLLSSIDEKIQYLQTVYSEFEHKVTELALVNQKIAEVMQSVETTEKTGNNLMNRVSQIISEVDILQQKENEIEEGLAEIEKKTSILQARQQDIKSLESKFEKVEGLMMDLSARHKQISTLQNRIENLKDETEEMKSNFEKLLETADEKFDKLSDFLSVIDSIYISNGKKGTGKESEAMKKKKATVIQLYENFDWSAETIAEKLNMEKSLVEAIINNRSTGKN